MLRSVCCTRLGAIKQVKGTIWDEDEARLIVQRKKEKSPARSICEQFTSPDFYENKVSDAKLVFKKRRA